jgi:quinoprotein glucose dehydrogenase
MLKAVDLAGQYLWEDTLEIILNSRQKEFIQEQKTWCPVVTAGGLFIAATSDSRFRFLINAQVSFMEYELPASGFATPAVYEIDGKKNCYSLWRRKIRKEIG